MSAGAEELARVVRATGVRDARVLDAVASVPRVEFVPASAERRAYRDEPIPILFGQVTTQPSLIARMVEALALEGHERVLEIGTGYGWQTALLARLAARVVSVERLAGLAEAARRNLQGLANVELVVADGSLGYSDRAPFDAIVVSAAFTSVPQPLAEQLVTGGRLVQPLGSGGHEDVVLFERSAAGLKARRSLTGAHFVRLYGAHAFAADDD
jgi:protein-L-isoaspartate(D-aspartate) O-methyltransferase